MANFYTISFSNKVYLLSFILCCGIVIQHIQWQCQDYTILNTIQTFTFFIAETCVPFFFMISGYLFFRTYSISNCKKKLFSRVHTLLIPYIIWNVVYTVFIISLHLLGFIYNMQTTENLWGGIKSCINSEYSPLWFVKYLIIFVCVSPFMYYILKEKFIGATAILALIFINAYNFYAGIISVPLNINANNWVMFVYQYIFFAIGCYGALCYKSTIEKISKTRSQIAIIILILLLCIYWLIITRYGNVITNHTFRWLWCIFLWFALDTLPNISPRPYMKYSFFIYCSHLLFLYSIQGVLSIVYTKFSTITIRTLQIAQYIWLPIITILLLIKIADYTKMYTPKIWKTITGNRG